jgi:hypothetical protein
MSPPRPRIVMISSTSLDLEAHRQQVRSACEEKLCLPRMMEHLHAGTPSGLAASLELVEQADVYIGLFAYRYGYIPPGHDRSITRQEYERAVERGIPVLIFLMSPDHPVLPDHVETGAGAEKLGELKRLLERSHTVKYFRSPEDLHSQVVLSLGRALADLDAKEKGQGDRVDPPAPPPSPAIQTQAPGSLRAQARDVFRIETHAGTAGSDLALTIDLGFSRVWLRNEAGQRLPLVCGCAIARSRVLFEKGRSRADPAIEVKPDGAQVIIEFGVGEAPTVRLETQLPRPFLEGRTQLVFQVDSDEGSTVDQYPRPAGKVTINPEWFRVARPGGVAGAEGIVPPEVEILLNALLEQQVRRSPPSRKFTF